MKASRTTSRIAIVIVTLAAFVAFASSAQAASARPAAMTKAEYRALMLRSEALNERYGNAVTRLSPLEFTALWQAGADRLEPQELVAAVTRGEALNEAYRRWKAQAAQRSVVSESSAAAAGFDWSEAGIGAAAMLGLVLLTGGSIVAVRHGRRVPSPRVS
jgi:hypothetical protein